MTAKEMFKKLGYIIRTDNSFELLYIKYMNSATFVKSIEFDKDCKRVIAYQIFCDDSRIPIHITVNEMTAINAQMQELGWI
ncbi:MAG: hypothetical protein GYA87_09390 [Christensenellaceae bacterium]|nr:hypothetical protein [Christensenellaceae bacterium]